MTLATQCPHCQTTFRVADDQLVAHSGLVRCGVCTRVFNGNAFLKQNDDSASADQALFEATLATTQHSVPVFPRTPVPASPDPDSFAETEVPDVDVSIGTDAAMQVDANNAIPASWQDTAPGESHLLSGTPAPEVDTGTGTPLGDEDDGDALMIEESPPEDDLAPLDAPVSQAGLHNEPKFIKANRQRQRMRKIMRIVMAVAAIPLLLAALGQGIYLWRHQIAMAFPHTKPWLIAACATLHCKVGLSTDIEQLSLESSELETLPDTPGTFALSVLLRNNADLPQAWPYIELTLNDTAEVAQVRRVFTPQEYLPATHPVADGFAQRSEQQVTVRFTLTDAVASGYRAYLFYP